MDRYRFRPVLTALEDRVVPSFDHLAYAIGLFNSLPAVARDTMARDGFDPARDIRPIWNARLTDNAELAHLRGTATDYASGTMQRSPWTGHWTVFYLVDVVATPTAADSLVVHELLHGFSYTYAEVYYGQRVSESGWWTSVWAGLGYRWGDREEALAIDGSTYLLRTQSYGPVLSLDNYFANLLGPPDTMGLPIGALYGAFWFAGIQDSAGGSPRFVLA